MLNEQAKEQEARTPEVAAEASLFGTSTQAGRLLGDAAAWNRSATGVVCGDRTARHL